MPSATMSEPNTNTQDTNSEPDFSPATTKFFRQGSNYLWGGEKLTLRLLNEKQFLAQFQDWRVRSWLTEIPGAKFAPNREDIYLPTTDIVCLKLAIAFPRENLDLDDGSAALINYFITQTEIGLQLAKQRAEFKINGILPKPPNGFIEHPVYPLKPHQQAALFTTVNTSQAHLFMDMGTGKTAVVIARICYLAHKIFTEQKRAYRCLIIVPKNVQLNWLYEFQKFAVVSGKMSVLRGTRLDRAKILIDMLREEPESEQCEYSILICSYATYRQDEDMLKNPWEKSGGKWDDIILDESHAIRNPAAEQTKACLRLSEHAHRKLILTGSPMCNHAGDLWAQLEFLGPGLSGFTRYDDFENFYVSKTATYNGRTIINGGTLNLPFLQEKLASLGFVVSKKEAMPSLPDKLYDTLEVEMTNKQYGVYRDLADQLAAEIENAKTGENEAVEINNTLTKLLRLAQVTSGFVGNEGEPIWIDKTPPKLQTLLDIYENELEPHEKMLVFVCFRPDLFRICEELTQKKIKHVKIYGDTPIELRQAACNLFNKNPEVRVFVGNSAACREGINLLGYDPTGPDSGMRATRVIYYSQNWSPVNRMQSEDRAHRIGTDMPVRYTDLCVPNTIDEEIRSRVLAKRDRAITATDLQDMLKRILSKE